jgi:predicted nucleic acid-binding protein
MILVDTSVWVDHLRRGNDELAKLLVDDRVLCHPFVVGELACGRLTDREEILGRLQALPQARGVEHREALHFIDMHRLAGVGLGWVDVNLIASAVLSAAALWSFDRGLTTAARRLGLAPRVISGPARS